MAADVLAAATAVAAPLLATEAAAAAEARAAAVARPNDGARRTTQLAARPVGRSPAYCSSSALSMQSVKRKAPSWTSRRAHGGGGGATLSGNAGESSRNERGEGVSGGVKGSGQKSSGTSPGLKRRATARSWRSQRSSASAPSTEASVRASVVCSVSSEEDAG
eukprot:scaffold197105_cov18-Tisochrysis_lutea.AAC.1